MASVLVMMSVYNGEAYIKDQIDSILNQKEIDVDLLIRNDGSKDSTINKLEEYNDDRIRVYSDENIGAAYSYMELIEKANSLIDNYDYFAFSDQDDIWYDDKLSNAIAQMESEKADLYCGSIELVDSFDHALNKRFICRSFSNVETILRNSVAGCTMVMNGRLIERIAKYKPAYIEMHDSWIMRVAQYTGLRITYDKVPCMKYRVHGKNVCGAKICFVDKVVQHYKKMFLYNKKVVVNTAHELLKGYSDLINDMDKQYLKAIDTEKHVGFRRTKLIKYAVKGDFSTKHRRIDYIIEIVFGLV